MKFNTMQFRAWSEMIAGNMHSSSSQPSMFVRTGDTQNRKSLTVCDKEVGSNTTNPEMKSNWG